ncbi:MAG TPA: GtrA family protein [Candidatus Limnocylindrales bacterium]
MTSTSPLSLSDPNRELFRQLASFGAIGAASTLAYVALYAFIRQVAPPALANGAALAITAVGNTAANRRLTFAVRGGRGLARDHAAGLIALAVALAISSASLAALDIVTPRPGRFSEIAVLVAANAVATLARFLLLRGAIGGNRSPAAHRAANERQSDAAQAPAARPPYLRLPAAQPFATLSQSKRTRG